MTDQQIATVAEGLTKAQRETLFDNRRCVASYEPAQKLVAKGLWTGEGDEYAIYPLETPLGLAVRQYLIEKEQKRCTPTLDARSPKGRRAGR